MRVIVSRESQLHRYLAESEIEPQRCKQTEALPHAPEKAALREHPTRQITLLTTYLRRFWQTVQSLLLLSATEAVISEFESESLRFGSSFRDDIKFAILHTDHLSSPFLNAFSILQEPLSIRMILARDHKQLVWSQIASIIRNTPHKSSVPRKLAFSTSILCMIVLGARSLPFAKVSCAIAIGFIAVEFFVSTHSIQKFSVFVEIDILGVAISIQKPVATISWQFRGISAVLQSDKETLSTIKRIEVVSRGHRLGSLLPPVGRMEQVEYDAQSTQPNTAPFFAFRCASMRCQLGDINEAIAQWINFISSQTMPYREKSIVMERNDHLEHPSLLIAALEKRYSIGSQLMEASLYRSLVNFVVDSIRILVSGDVRSNSWIDRFEAQMNRLELVTKEMREWHMRLEVSLSLVQGSTSTKSISEIENPSIQHEMESSDTRTLDQVQMALNTLNALVWSCRSALSCQQEGKDLELVRLGKQMHVVASEMQSALDVFTMQLEPKSESKPFVQQPTLSKIATKESNANIQAHRSEEENTERYLMVFQGTSLGHDTFDLEQNKEEKSLATENASRSMYHQELKDILTSRLKLSAKEVRVKDLDQVETKKNKQKRSIHFDPMSSTTRKERSIDKEMQQELANILSTRR
uniref:AlNc14C511G11991 protein n=1 Tax=Albugo laibachii Nc14 TaxID=890382 RepID=F0X0P6_9STRA|nr:AlNc14C511G11991 [Albugo laibachii Nc14]|eukprot:CCA27340.1 AlNc14C511G11991 [Albugo laibachii Nc14]